MCEGEKEFFLLNYLVVWLIGSAVHIFVNTHVAFDYACYRSRVGLVHKCVMVNENLVDLQIRVDEPDMDSKLISLSFSISELSNPSSPVQGFEKRIEVALAGILPSNECCET